MRKMLFGLLILGTSSAFAFENQDECKLYVNLSDSTSPTDREMRKLERKGYVIVEDRQEANLVFRRRGYSAPDRKTGVMYASQIISIVGEINGNRVEEHASWENRDLLVDIPVQLIKNSKLINKLKSCDEIIEDLNI